MPSGLLPDRRGRTPLHGLCVMADCTRRRSRSVVLRVGGREQHVEVCELHARALDRQRP